MGSRNNGFTLIELVVTLSVVAILAALAWPRYIALQTQARVAKTQAIFGGMRSAAMLAHAQALATNTVTSGPAVVPMEGKDVTVVNGYPTADASGIITATQMDPIADQVTLSGGGPIEGDLLTIDIDGGLAGSCTVIYQAPAAANTSPGIGLSTVGC